jgi:ankyrin repeat protein
MYASSGGYLDIVRLLLSSGASAPASINERNREGATALYLVRARQT